MILGFLVFPDLTQDSTDAVQQVCDIRWKIEEFHARNKAINGRGILPVPESAYPEKSY
jgi:hypothetical protein